MVWPAVRCVVFAMWPCLCANIFGAFLPRLMFCGVSGVMWPRWVLLTPCFFFYVMSFSNSGCVHARLIMSDPPSNHLPDISFCSISNLACHGASLGFLLTPPPQHSQQQQQFQHPLPRLSFPLSSLFSPSPFSPPHTTSLFARLRMLRPLQPMQLHRAAKHRHLREL